MLRNMLRIIPYYIFRGFVVLLMVFFLPILILYSFVKQHILFGAGLRVISLGRFDGSLFLITMVQIQYARL